MKLADAQRELTKLTGDERFKHDPFGYQQVTDRYQTCSDEEADRILDIFVTILLNGTTNEQDFAAGFLAVNQPPEDVTHRIVQAYASRKPDDLAPLQRVLGNFAANVSATDEATLKTLFLNDPVTHLNLAEVLMVRHVDEDVWTTFAATVQESQTVETLREAFSAAYVANRANDFFALLSERTPEFLGELARTLPTGFGEQLLDGRGLK